MKYQKIPSVIDACQFLTNELHAPHDGVCPIEVVSFVYHPGMGHSGECPSETCKLYPRQPVVFTTQGAVVIKSGDWVAHQIVNGKDDYWPIAAETFARTYKVVQQIDQTDADILLTVMGKKDLPDE